MRMTDLADGPWIERHEFDLALIPGEQSRQSADAWRSDPLAGLRLLPPSDGDFAALAGDDYSDAGADYGQGDDPQDGGEGTDEGGGWGDDQPADIAANPENLPPGTPVMFLIPTDNRFGSSWHLLNTGQGSGTPGIDINVTRAWDDYTGRGVKLAIYDNAVQYTHPDLAPNYDSSLHLVVDGKTWEASPRNYGKSGSGGDVHGSSVAGVAAAAANGTDGVGVAFNATIVGVPIIRSSEPLWHTLAMPQMWRFDVVNHSWGFTDAFYVDRASPAFVGIFGGIRTAVETGRGGLGTIIVKAAGNGRTANQETNQENFGNDRHLVHVAALNNKGGVASFSTPGASLLVSAPGENIVAPDLTGTSGDVSGDYKTNFAGTSAAAPMVSGVAALILEANPLLGWRDVRDILAMTARRVGSMGSAPEGHEIYGWTINAATNWNGGGMHFSNDYGFGLVDALAAVRLAESWTPGGTSASERSAVGTTTVTRAIPDNTTGGVSYAVTVPSGVAIETIEIGIDIRHAQRTQLQIEVISPSGTRNIVLDTPKNPGFNNDYFVWTLTSNAFWGEQSGGTWTVIVRDLVAGTTGTVNSITVRAFGDEAGADSVYVYTNEFGSLATEPTRATLVDASGTDTLNAAAVSSNLVIDLRPGAVSTIAGRPLTIAAGTTIENAFGGDGNDLITGNSAANRLSGGRGEDMIEGGAGNDIIDGGPGTDTAVYSLARAQYQIAANADGSTTVRALSGSDGIDTLRNVEQLRFADGLYTIAGLPVSSVPLTLVGTAGPDTLSGAAGNDTISGLAGNDTLSGGDGDDVLEGGLGADILDGGPGFDVASYANATAAVTVSLATGLGTAGEASGDSLISIEGLLGSAFNDALTGDGGANTLWGGAGNDRLDGGAGADRMEGGPGNDTYYVDNSGDLVIELAGEGTDTVFASVNYTLPANVENGNVWGSAGRTLTGNSLDNTLTGGSGADILWGLGGKDVLRGGNGDDQLFGGDGDDVLRGGNGWDRLTGGAGADRFEFTSVKDSPVNKPDEILDFQRGQDRIDLSAIDANGSAISGNGVFSYLGTGAFTGALGEVRWTPVASGPFGTSYILVEADTNGDRVADMAIIIRGGTDPLTVSDFIL
jgi:Ca2+-binding RTX toxin-like protein